MGMLSGNAHLLARTVGSERQQGIVIPVQALGQTALTQILAPRCISFSSDTIPLYLSFLICKMGIWVPTS